MNAPLKKLLPENLEAEMCVLGAVFCNANALYTATGILSEEQFSSRRNRTIFSAMVELSRAKESCIDVLTVSDQLRQKGVLDEVGGIEYLTEIEEAVPTATTIAHHAGIVKNKFTLRKLVKVGQGLYEDSWNERAEPKELIEKFQRQIFDLSLSNEAGHGMSHVSAPHEWAMECFERASQWMDNPQGVRGIATGFNRLDMLMRGLKDVNIISASTGMGKTALGLNWAVSIGIGQKIPCLYLNYEMNRDELEMRVQSILSLIPINNIFSGRYNAKYPFAEIGKASEQIAKGKLFITGNQPKGINTTIALIHKYAAQEKVQVVFVDYLGEIEPDAQAVKENSEYRTFGRWLGMLKNTCASVGVKLVLLAQLNREGEGKPGLSKIGGSWKIAQKADTFVIIKKDLDDNYSLLIAKNRNGTEQKTIDINFDKDTQRIYEV
jgi:replicative DNA helicase